MSLKIALNINPYHLGFSIWDRLIEAHGIEHARTIMSSEDDFGFVRNHLDTDLADDLNLFVYDEKRNGEVKVTANDIHLLHEAILSPKFNFGAPRVSVTEMGVDGALELKHETGVAGSGLDMERAQKVIDYIHRVWRRPVTMRTLDGSGKESTLETGKAAA